MMTVTSMAQNAYMEYRLRQDNSAFAAISSQSGNLFGTSSFPSISNPTDQLESALSDRLSDQMDAFKTFDDYSKKSTAFYSDFFPTINNLKDSAETLKKTDFNATDTSDVVKNVQAFADNYNSTLKFFADNSKISNRVADLSTSFSAPKYQSRAYESIGINVDSTGKLSVDSTKLASALTSDTDRVKNLLGEKGLSGQAYNKANAAAANSANLVPFPKLPSGTANGMMQGIFLDMFA